MIRGKELKRYIEAIPDNAVVIVGGNRDVDIIGVEVSVEDGKWLVNLPITEGYSITKDSVLKSMFNCLRDGRK